MWKKGRETVMVYITELRDNSTKGKSWTSVESWFEKLTAKMYLWEN